METKPIETRIVFKDETSGVTKTVIKNIEKLGDTIRTSTTSIKEINGQIKSTRKTVKDVTDPIANMNNAWRNNMRTMLPLMFFAQRMAKSFSWLGDEIKKTYHAGEIFAIQQLIMSSYMDTWIGQLESDTLAWFADWLASHPTVAGITGAITKIGEWITKIITFGAMLSLMDFTKIFGEGSVLRTGLNTAKTLAGDIFTKLTSIKDTAWKAIVTFTKPGYDAIVAAVNWIKIQSLAVKVSFSLILAAAVWEVLNWIDNALARLEGFKDAEDKAVTYAKHESTVGLGLGTSSYYDMGIAEYAQMQRSMNRALGNQTIQRITNNTTNNFIMTSGANGNGEMWDPSKGDFMDWVD